MFVGIGVMQIIKLLKNLLIKLQQKVTIIDFLQHQGPRFVFRLNCLGIDFLQHQGPRFVFRLNCLVHMLHQYLC